MTVITPSQIRYVWVNFQPDGTINAHRDGASVVKNGTGDYTVTYAFTMPSDFYALSIIPIDSSGSPFTLKVISQLQGSCRFQFYGGAVEVLSIGVCSSQVIDPSVGVSFLACA